MFPITDTFVLPEESPFLGHHLFYFPNDTSQCVLSPAYIVTLVGIIHSGWLKPIFYKWGIGETYNSNWDGDCLMSFTNGLNYTNIHGVNCGTLHPLETNSVTFQNNLINIFPNPATTEITITSPNKINQVTITNLLGQIVYTHEYNTEKVQVDVAELRAGIYFVKINGSEVRKFVKE